MQGFYQLQLQKEISKNLNGLVKGYKDEEVQAFLNKMITEKYSTNLIKTKYVNDSKITDHYAIIPTGQGFENFETLPDLHKKVYNTIVKRFVAVFYPPAEFNKVNLTVNVEDETFYASGKVCVNQGYMEVLKPKNQAKKAQRMHKMWKMLRKKQMILQKKKVQKMMTHQKRII